MFHFDVHVGDAQNHVGGKQNRIGKQEKAGEQKRQLLQLQLEGLKYKALWKKRGCSVTSAHTLLMTVCYCLNLSDVKYFDEDT